MNSNSRWVLSSPRRFRIFSLFVLLIILAFELYGINQLALTLPSTIDIDNSRIILQGFIVFDGVLLGFAAIVFASLISHETVPRRKSYIILSMAATAGTFLLSVLATFLSLATMVDGLTPTSFKWPLGLTIAGTTIFFYAIFIYTVRTYLLGESIPN